MHNLGRCLGVAHLEISSILTNGISSLQPVQSIGWCLSQQALRHSELPNLSSLFVGRTNVPAWRPPRLAVPPTDARLGPATVQ